MIMIQRQGYADAFHVSYPKVYKTSFKNIMNLSIHVYCSLTNCHLQSNLLSLFPTVVQIDTDPISSDHRLHEGFRLGSN